jgi:poly(hydroxyalkanoate) depolymerase family esterase
MLMRRSLIVSLVAAAALAATAFAPVLANPPATAESFAYSTEGPLDHWLFVPEGEVPAAGRPLVVYLHGCTQRNATDPQVAFGTRWNELARREGAVVLYPLQDLFDMADPAAVHGNGSSCWNWFLEKNLHRGAGEPAAIAALTEQVAAANHVDPERIYVMGTSAGASMANIVATTYPDRFRAVAAFAGCAYSVCADTSGRLAYDEIAANGLSPVPAILFQGTGDTLSNVALGSTLISQQVGTHDWADDGDRNGSITRTSSETSGDATEISPGQGNICVGPHSNWPCPAGVTGWSSYPYTVDRFSDAGGRVVVESWMIHGLGHNYPGGDYSSTFTDPAGPDITSAAWRFFQQA